MLCPCRGRPQYGEEQTGLASRSEKSQAVAEGKHHIQAFWEAGPYLCLMVQGDPFVFMTLRLTGFCEPHWVLI